MVNKLTDHLLEKLSFINFGFDGIYLDSITGKLISYIRENGEETYRVINQVAPKTIETSQDFRIVVSAGELDATEVKSCVLNALFSYKINNSNVLTVLNSSINVGKIINEEYPKLSASDRLDIIKKIKLGSLIAVNFRLTGKINENNCKCKICE